MNGNRSAGFAKTLICVLAPLLTTGIGKSMAQSQPATIPMVVAQAMAFEPAMLGRPQFFDGRTPTDWPADLVPPAVKVLGGGIIGDSTIYRIRVAVFEFSAQSKPHAAIEDMIMRAGYARPASQPAHSRTGGFVETAAPTSPDGYCKGSLAVMFGAVDSARAPMAFAVFLLDGEAARQKCNRNGNEPNPHRFPVSVPSLAPPAGALSFGEGISWSGSGGDMRSTLRTTMPTDSLLAHYSAQLVAGGWKPEGGPANADGIGAQRFSFRDGQDAWSGALIIMAVGERREVLLRVSKME